MNVASLELCRELFELSRWDDTYDNWLPDKDGQYEVRGGAWYNKNPRIPAYDIDYLLRIFAGKGGIDIRFGDVGCIAISQMRVAIDDTPENAACRLAIDLFQLGILKRE